VVRAAGHLKEQRMSFSEPGKLDLWRSKSFKRPHHQQRGRFCPGLECLEERVLLNSSALLAQPNVIGDAGFETVYLGTGNGTYGATNYRYSPSGSSWTFTGSSPSGSGIAGNASGFTFGNPNAPEGVQVAFLQDSGTTSQSVNFAAGSYTLSFQAAQRGNYQYTYQTFQVLVDGTVVGTFQPASTSYAQYTTNRFTVMAGNHTIEFAGLNPNGGDNTAFIDQVSVNAVAAPPTITSQPASQTVAAGQSATFSVTASGTGPLSYQWQKLVNGTWTNISGATSASFAISSAQAGDAGQYQVVVTNSAGSATSSTVSLTVNAVVVGTGTGLTGQYFNDQSLTNLVLTRTDATVNFNWGGGSPDPSVPADHFSARWTGQVEAQVSETYTFYTESDDGVRLWVNGQLLIDNWTDHSPTENSATIALVAGQKYDIKMEYYEDGGGATAQLLWSSASSAKQAVPTSQLYVASSVADAGFEAPNVGAGTYGAFQYDPSGVAWSFSGNAGVAGNGSGFTSGNPSAPEGTQVGFLQMTGSFSQSVNLAAGSYQIGFWAAQRANYGGAQSFKVLVDGQVVSTFSGLSTAYTSLTTSAFTVAAGNHTITFQGLDPDSGDDTAFIDNVQIAPAAAATYTLSASPGAPAPGDTITVNWTAPAGHSAGSGGDWIGMYAVGSSNYPYLAYQWVGSGTSGSVTFTAPSAPGSYEFRYFPNDGLTVATTSNAVQVQAAKPATPSNLTATAGDGQVALSWPASTGATSYNVYRWSGSAWVVIQNVSGTSATDTGLTNGTTYYYEVSAVNSGGESNATNYVIAVPQGAVSITTQPTDTTVSGTSANLQVSATDSTGGINLVYTWSEISGPAAVTFTANGTHNASNTTANFSAAGVYQFQVMVSNGVNTTTSNPVTVTVNQTLTGLTISPAAATVYDGSALLLIANGLDQFGAAETLSYSLWWVNDTFIGPVYVAPSSGSGTDTIKASGVAGSTQVSAQTTINYQPAPLAAPAGLTASGANAEAMLGWSAVSGATSYNIYRATASGGEDLYQKGITTTSWTDTGLNPNNTRYYYQVQSVNSTGNGPLSSEVSAPLTAPAAPTNLNSTPASGTVSLSWTTAPGAGNYNVYYATSSGNETLYKSGISTTTWTVTGLNNGASYYFKVTASNSAGQGSLSAEVSAVPSGGNDWFALNIPDVGLRMLARTDLTRDGAITYSDMLGLLNQAIAEGTVTTTMLTSLQALVSSSGATYLNMPASVQYLGNALVGGLSAGTTASQEQALVNQWFLGAVHPTLDVNTSATGYALAGSSLFGSSGAPLYTDISQGGLGDCWLMASLAETAYKAPGIIEANFTDDGLQMVNGVQVHIWTLRYGEGATAKYLTLDNYLPVDGNGFCYAHCDVMWAALYEKAFATINGGYASLEGGAAIGALPLITGGTVGTLPFGAALADIGQTAYTKAVNSSTTLLTVASFTTDFGFVSGHDYAVLWSTGSGSSATYQLYNPWGFQQPQAVTWAQITQEGNLLAADGDEIVGAAPAVSRDPAVPAANMVDQTLGTLANSLDAPGSAAGSFVADANLSGSTRVSSPAPETVWRNSRTGDMTQAIPNLTPMDETLPVVVRCTPSAYDIGLLQALPDADSADYLAGHPRGGWA
jgi:fibronectin type 3 domain-containing protein